MYIGFRAGHEAVVTKFLEGVYRAFSNKMLESLLEASRACRHRRFGFSTLGYNELVIVIYWAIDVHGDVTPENGQSYP